MSVPAEDFARRAAELAERAAGPRPESWRPDKAEEGHPNPIIGVLVRVKAGGDRGYGPTMIAQLRAVDGTGWDVWLLGQVLQDEFDQHAAGTVRPGDMVAITFEGMKPKRSGDGHYRSYRVVVDRPAGEQTADRAERHAESHPHAFAGAAEGSGSPGSGAPEARCEQCGYADPKHAPDCLPF